MANRRSLTVGISTAVPEDFYEQLPWFKELPESTQTELRTKTLLIHNEITNVVKSRMNVVQLVKDVQGLLKEEGRFGKYLHTLDSSYRSVYRWIRRYEELALPKPVLDKASEMGIDLIDTRYYAAAKVLGKSRALTKSPREYCGRLIVEADKIRKIEPKEPQAVEIEAFRKVRNLCKMVPAAKREAWLERLFGRLLTDFKVPSSVTVKPVPVPEGFRPNPKGRPPVKE